MDLNRKMKATITGTYDPDTLDTLVPKKKSIVMQLTPTQMAGLRKLKPGSVIEFAMGSDHDWYKGNFKIKRRDWKRCKVYLLEV